MALRATGRLFTRISPRVFSLGEPGSGAGKSGGSGGSIRDAGGAFGKMEAAREGEYFHKLQQKQMSELRKHLEEELAHTEAQHEKTKKDLARHKERLAEIEKFEKASKK